MIRRAVSGLLVYLATAAVFGLGTAGGSVLCAAPQHIVLVLALEFAPPFQLNAAIGPLARQSDELGNLR